MALPGSSQGIVGIRWGRRDSTGAGLGPASLTVPAHISRSLPDGAIFRAEWHQDGILYRFLGIGPAAKVMPDLAVPAWAQNGSEPE